MTTKCLRCSVIKQAGERLEELFDKKDEMKDGDYLKQTNCIKQIYDKLETESCECEKKEYLSYDDFLAEHRTDEDGDEHEFDLVEDSGLIVLCEVEELSMMNCKQRYIIATKETYGIYGLRRNGIKQTLFTFEKAYEIYNKYYLTGIKHLIK
tara:strand:+ start:709 stop:1164 length:456 start_codon:yes stop_codon:yes gene_type:complete